MKEAIWTWDDAAQAASRGWDIFDAASSEQNTSGRRRFQLQKCDETAVFDSDEEVWQHVWARGCVSPDTLEGRALAYLFEQSPEEFKEIAIYSWQRKAA